MNYCFIIFALSATQIFADLPNTVKCEGNYERHLQGICRSGENIYWSFTTQLVKTDQAGRVLKSVPVANHHGDLCSSHGKLYVAVNLGQFNNAEGKADSWVYVYDTDSLDEISRHPVQDVFHGAGGIGENNGNFYVVGGLPEGVTENFVYEYDSQFRFVKKHVIKSGHTLMGIQTATYAHNRWWFGCYGTPKILLVTDDQFRMIGRYEYDCSLGIEAFDNGHLLSASGTCQKEQGCNGSLQVVVPDEKLGLRPIEPSALSIR